MASADCASFFSLLRTFSLPGMTTYSVSKSFSMSTPSVLLGKSFTCPSEASTVKPRPRYFWIVLALAGDSTMTSALGKFLTPSETLARSVADWRQDEQEATSGKRSEEHRVGK